jgi:prevent-host-death family protein
MGRTITVYDAKTNFSKVLAEVEAGAEYVVTRNGVPCARMVPLVQATRVPLGFARGRVTDAFFEPLPEAELAGWETSFDSTTKAAPRAKAGNAKGAGGRKRR